MRTLNVQRRELRAAEDLQHAHLHMMQMKRAFHGMHAELDRRRYQEVVNGPLRVYDDDPGVYVP